MSETCTPIDLYYWPTPNGWKISIMLEERGLSYMARAVDIGAGEPFRPEFLDERPSRTLPHHAAEKIA